MRNKWVFAAAAALPVAVLSMPAQALEDKGSFSCKGESDGSYINPDSCTSFIDCDDGRKTVRECPEGEVISTLKAPPWKCEPAEVAGLSTDCKRIDKPAAKVKRK